MNRDVMRIDKVQTRNANDHPANQLAQNRRLPDPLRQFAADFRRHENRD